MVQRLVQKEKHVLQLQAELDRLQAQNPGEGRDTVRSFLVLHRRSLIQTGSRMNVQKGSAIADLDNGKFEPK